MKSSCTENVETQCNYTLKNKHELLCSSMSVTEGRKWEMSSPRLWTASGPKSGERIIIWNCVHHLCVRSTMSSIARPQNANWQITITEVLIYQWNQLRVWFTNKKSQCFPWRALDMMICKTSAVTETTDYCQAQKKKEQWEIGHFYGLLFCLFLSTFSEEIGKPSA